MERFKKMIGKKVLALNFVLIAVHLFADSYCVRMIYESSRSGTFMRSEEVYETADVKVVIVSMPQNFTWVRIKDRWYIGDKNTLVRTFPIKDLVDVAYEYIKEKKLDISRDGVYKFNEDFFSIEIFVVDKEIVRVTRKVGDVTTTMYINKFPKQFDMKNILSKYKFVEESPIPEVFFNVFKLFLWSNVSEVKDTLRISGYDKDGKPLELEISKVSGDFKVGNYYLKVLKASESTMKEIKNAMRDN
ncbi:MAG: hypothetical protein N2Z58_05875 [Fervidobacterium sp.]|nr:hypothetical protein [Fervidobacterium sp.]